MIRVRKSSSFGGRKIQTALGSSRRQSAASSQGSQEGSPQAGQARPSPALAPHQVPKSGSQHVAACNQVGPAQDFKRPSKLSYKLKALFGFKHAGSSASNQRRTTDLDGAEVGPLGRGMQRLHNMRQQPVGPAQLLTASPMDRTAQSGYSVAMPNNETQLSAPATHGMRPSGGEKDANIAHESQAQHEPEAGPVRAGSKWRMVSRVLFDEGGAPVPSSEVSPRGAAASPAAPSATVQNKPPGNNNATNKPPPAFTANAGTSPASVASAPTIAIGVPVVAVPASSALLASASNTTAPPALTSLPSASATSAPNLALAAAATSTTVEQSTSAVDVSLMASNTNEGLARNSLRGSRYLPPGKKWGSAVSALTAAGMLKQLSTNGASSTAHSRQGSAAEPTDGARRMTWGSEGGKSHHEAGESAQAAAAAPADTMSLTAAASLAASLRVDSSQAGPSLSRSTSQKGMYVLTSSVN